jgi:hypothetical protein
VVGAAVAAEVGAGAGAAVEAAGVVGAEVAVEVGAGAGAAVDGVVFELQPNVANMVMISTVATKIANQVVLLLFMFPPNIFYVSELLSNLIILKQIIIFKLMVFSFKFTS